MSVMVTVADRRWSDLGDMDQLAAQVDVAVTQDGEYDIAILFTDDDEMREHNKTWRGQDKATNVLSFPAAAMGKLPDGVAAPLGDIVLAYETVMREAAEQSKLPLHHVTHLLVHGMLHLLGYDHESDSEALTMENKERTILASFHIADPYAA
jgi:probable rRNA maturation factor